MPQQSFTDLEYASRKKQTRRDAFLKAMEEIIPWEDWTERIRPYYPDGKRGRPVRGIGIMLRMHLLQRWFRLSDAAAEDAVYDSYAMRAFLRIDFLSEQVPSETTLRRFRHLLKKHGLEQQFSAELSILLRDKGLVLQRGHLSDAVLLKTASAGKKEEAEEVPGQMSLPLYEGEADI